MNFSQIYEGWRNKLVPPSHMKELINKVSDERMNTCRGCAMFSENRKVLDHYRTLRTDEHCTDCGCTLSAKTKCLSCECPRGLWKAVPEVTQDMDHALTEYKK